jgi:hypothetical protein
MIELDFEINVTPVIAALQQGERQLDANIKAFLEAAKPRLIEAVSGGMPVDVGTARDSIRGPIELGTVSTLRIHSVDDPAKIGTIEAGRQPGATAPPASALLPWVRRKWGGDLFDAIQLAQRIKERGSHQWPDGHQPFQKAADTQLPLLEYLSLEIVNVF